MAIQTSTRRGVQSSSRKAASSRHGTEPQPRTQPVAGAFGREGADRQTPLPAGPLQRRPRVVTARRITAQAQWASRTCRRSQSSASNGGCLHAGTEKRQPTPQEP